MMTSPETVFFLSSEAETEAFGARLAQMLEPGDIVTLYGDLGAGKTTLSRGVIKALMSQDTDVPSPTYTIVQTYECDAFLLWHFDLYRLEAPDEVIELGFEEALDDVCLIEWPENAGDHLPSGRLSIKLESADGGRHVSLIPGDEFWEKRLDEHFA